MIKIPKLQWREMLIGCLAGGLVAGGLVGTIGYLGVQGLKAENTQLQAKVKTMSSAQKKLSQTAASLEEQLNGIKEKQGQGYDQTIDALMQAKATSDIDALYEIGLKAMQEKDYPSAYYALSQVNKTNPAFKDIKVQYPLAEKAYNVSQSKQIEQNLAAAYAQGCDFQIKGQYAQAQAAFARVLAIKADYRDARVRLSRVSQRLALAQQSQDYAQKMQWLAASYSLGVNKQALGRLAEARETFEAIAQYAPRYRDVASRLKTLRAAVPNAASLGSAANCYSKGMTMGTCAKSPTAPGCAQLDMTHTPAECRGNPDFQKGLALAMGRQLHPNTQQPAAQTDTPDLQPDQNPDDAEDSNDNTQELIKDFPNWLGHL